MVGQLYHFCGFPVKSTAIQRHTNFAWAQEALLRAKMDLWYGGRTK